MCVNFQHTCDAHTRISSYSARILQWHQQHAHRASVYTQCTCTSATIITAALCCQATPKYADTCLQGSGGHSVSKVCHDIGRDTYTYSLSIVPKQAVFFFAL